MEAFTSVSTAYRPSRIEALLILTLVAMAALALVGGWDQAVDPFLRNDDYPAFFAQLDAEGYAGFVSGEYKPRGATADGLGWIVAR